MKRPLLVITLAVLMCVARNVVEQTAITAAPLAQEPRPVIAQPEPDAAVRGVVQIIGTAVHPQFQRYEIYYAPWPVPSDQSWVFIGEAKFQQQPLGLLGTWDSRAVPDGAYALRVRVVKEDGNYNDSDARRVLVANTRPVESPTQTPTDTPTPAPVPVVDAPTAAPPSEAPTVAIELPITEAPTDTPEPVETAVVATPEPESAATIDAGGVFSASRLAETAQKAATYTAGFFVVVGAFFGIKAIFYWLWQRIRP